jgi:hypothetical protein
VGNSGLAWVGVCYMKTSILVIVLFV